MHWVDLGFDTGDIVRQVKVPIRAGDNYATLLTKAEELCADTLVKAIAGHFTRRRISTSCSPRSIRSGCIAAAAAMATKRDRLGVGCGGDGALHPRAGTTWNRRAPALEGHELCRPRRANPHARPSVRIFREVRRGDGNGILVNTFIRLTRWAPVRPDGLLGEAAPSQRSTRQPAWTNLKTELDRGRSADSVAGGEAGLSRGIDGALRSRDIAACSHKAGADNEATAVRSEKNEVLAQGHR